MAARIPKPAPRSRVRSLTGGLPPQAIGPLDVKGRVRGTNINAPVWWIPDTYTFLFADGTLAFDATPTNYKAPAESGNAHRRKEITQALIDMRDEMAHLISDQRGGQLTAKGSKTLRAMQSASEELAVELDTLKTSTERIKMSEVVPPNVARLAIQRKGKATPVYMERDKSEGKIRFYTRGLLSAAKAGNEDSRDVVRLREVLKGIVPTTAQDSGEGGYVAVSQWDFSRAASAMVERGGFQLMGQPDVELIADLKSIDAAAKRIAVKDIYYGAWKPILGVDTKTNASVDFQTDGIRFLMSRKSAILADDMGLGKTYQAIIAAHNSVPKSEQILVVCPAAVMHNWGNDLRTFLPSAAMCLLDSKEIKAAGEPSRRPEKVRFVIVSYQGASTLSGAAAVSKVLQGRKWGCLILDEAHRIKKAGSLGHMFLQKLDTERLWMLTGTPIANKIVDMFGLLKIGQHPAGTRMDQFLQSYAPSVAKQGQREAIVDFKPLERLGKAITGFVLRRTKEDVLKKKLPEKVGGIGQKEAIVHVELPEDVQMLIEKHATRSSDSGKGRVNTEVVRHAIAVCKVPATWEVVERVLDGGGRAVVFSTYTDVMDSLVELCEDRKVLCLQVRGGLNTLGKSAIVKLFQDIGLDADEEKWVKRTYGQWLLNLLHRVPLTEWAADDKKLASAKFGKNPASWPTQVDVFIGQMVAASEGVTLTKADCLIFNDLDWMPSRHEQAEDRIYRISRGDGTQHKQVFIMYMLANHPIDRQLWEQLFRKKIEIDTVYDAIGGDAAGAASTLRMTLIKDLENVNKVRKLGRSRQWQSTLGL